MSRSVGTLLERKAEPIIANPNTNIGDKWKQCTGIVDNSQVKRRRLYQSTPTEMKWQGQTKPHWCSLGCYTNGSNLTYDSMRETENRNVTLREEIDLNFWETRVKILRVFWSICFDIVCIV